jgi:hypothetical protein
VYSDDWKFETSTLPYDIYANLLERKITLQKNTTRLTLILSPIRVGTGCGGPDDSVSTGSAGILLKYNIGNNLYQYGAKGSVNCSLLNRISSNIKVSDVKVGGHLTQKQFDESSIIGNMPYIFTMKLESNVSSEIVDAEKIIAQSTFK